MQGPFGAHTPRPHVFFTLMFAGAVVGTITSYFSHQLNALGTIFVWSGCFIVLRHAWTQKPTWTEILRQPILWAGLLLAAIGNLMALKPL
jgi:hypothetical protein